MPERHLPSNRDGEHFLLGEGKEARARIHACLHALIRPRCSLAGELKRPLLFLCVLRTACKAQEAPENQLHLEHVYGYNGDLIRYGGYERYCTNVLWLRTGEIIFPSSCVVVILSNNSEVNEQRFFQGHDADVMALARHPKSDLCASAQSSRPAKICVFDAAQKIPQLITGFSAGPSSRGR